VEIGFISASLFDTLLSNNVVGFLVHTDGLSVDYRGEWKNSGKAT
jgi:hypothetical protein